MARSYNQHNLSLSQTQAWDIVAAHAHTIERLVDAAIGRGVVARQDRADAITDATVIAFELAQRYNPAVGPFESYLSSSLHRRLYDHLRHSTDALDHATESETVAEAVPERTAAASADSAVSAVSVVPMLAELIAARVPGRLQAIARMALIDNLSLNQIANRTGRKGAGRKKELRRVITHCVRLVFKGRKDGDFAIGIKSLE